jgi:hypothetical protein
MKNLGGYDRIPKRIIVEGVELLLRPFSILFSKIYKEITIQGEWLNVKTIPIFKNKIENNLGN